MEKTPITQRLRNIFHPYSYENKELPQKATLEQVVIGTAFDKNRAIDPHVTSIELGQYTSLADTLVTETMNDSKHREKAALIRVRKKAYKEPYVYTKRQKEINGKRFSWSMSPFNTVRSVTVADMHSHPIELPPSPEDLYNIFLLTGPTINCVFVSTQNKEHDQPGKKYLIFRGQQTPKAGFYQANRIISEFYEPYFGDTKFNLAHNIWDEMRGVTSVEGINEAKQREGQENLLKQFAKLHDLKIFIAEAGEQTAHLVPLD